MQTLKKIKNIVLKENIIDINVLKISFIIWLFLNLIGWTQIYFDIVYGFKISILRVLNYIYIYMLVYMTKYFFVDNKEEWASLARKIIVLYFFVNLIVIFMEWPGNFTWDDLFTVYNAQKYDLTPWQHFFTGIFHVINLQLLPFPTGVIIIQIYIASIIVAYCVSNIAYILIKNNENRNIVIGILLLPMFMLPVLFYLYTTIRIGMYMYIELLLIVELIVMYNKEGSIKINKILFVSFLCILVASWRTEGLYYIVAFPIILMFINKRKISKKIIFIVFIAISILTVSIGKLNNKLIGNNNYSIVITVLPLLDLVRNADPVKDKEDLENLDKIIDLNIIYNDSTINGEMLYWTGLKRDYTPEQYKKYFKSYFSMVKKYPYTVFRRLMINFLESSGVIIKDGYSRQNRNASFGDLIYTGERGKAWSEIRSHFKQPINMQIRNETMKFFDSIDDTGRVTPTYIITWNLLIPLFLIFICLIYKLYKKDWFMVLIILTVLARVPIVFVTSSISYLMYYLSVYLLLYFLSFFIIMQAILEYKNSRRKNSNEKVRVI